MEGRDERAHQRSPRALIRYICPALALRAYDRPAEVLESQRARERIGEGDQGRSVRHTQLCAWHRESASQSIARPRFGKLDAAASFTRFSIEPPLTCGDTSDDSTSLTAVNHAICAVVRGAAHPIIPELRSKESSQLVRLATDQI